MEVVLWIIALVIIICLVVKNRSDKRQIEIYQSFHLAIASALTGKDLTLKEPPHQSPSPGFDPDDVVAEFRKKIDHDGRVPRRIYDRYFPSQLSLRRVLDLIKFHYSMSIAMNNLTQVRTACLKTEEMADAINNFLKAVREGMRFDTTRRLSLTNPIPQYTDMLQSRLEKCASREGRLVIMVSFNGQMQSVVYVDTEEISIGQDSDNDIILDNFPVSPYHAKIIFKDGNITVVDDNSIEGTFVGGEKIAKQIIKKSDTISIGKYQLKVLA